MKTVRIRSFSGPYFPAFGMNSEFSVRMQENMDQKKPEYAHFSRSVNFFKVVSVLFLLFLNSLGILNCGSVNLQPTSPKSGFNDGFNNVLCR